MIVNKDGEATTAEIIELRPQKLSEEKRATQSALAGLADALMRLEDESVPEAYQLVDFVDKWAKETRGKVRDRLLLWLSTHGVRKTEKGTHEGILGGRRVRAVPQASGPDADKLKALLVAKGVQEPEKYFEQVITYKPTKTSLDVLVATKVLTEEEAESVLKDTSYRVEIK